MRRSEIVQFYLDLAEKKALSAEERDQAEEAERHEYEEEKTAFWRGFVRRRDGAV
jgi:hypothetical protein